MKTISAPALKRLSTLYSLAAKHHDFGTSREERIEWAARILNHPVASFKELSAGDAKLLIDTLQISLGQAETAAPRRGYSSTRDRQKQGTEGRRDQLHAETTILDGDEEVLSKIQLEMSTLGWDMDRLAAFLRSSHGPLNGRTHIRTLADANRVHWALKRIAHRKENAA